MATIGRNDPCPCGSGKKYKKCHIQSGLPGGASPGTTTTKKVSMTFGNLLSDFQTEPVLATIAALQLHPPNHGRNIHFEEMARDCLQQLRANANLAVATWPEIQSAISSCGKGQSLEPPLSTFTGNVIYDTGNNIVYPGIYNHACSILNEIITAITFFGSDLPENFKSNVTGTIRLMLEISDTIARELNHPRYINYKNESNQIEIPSRDIINKAIEAVTFETADLKDICAELQMPLETFNDFIINPDAPELAEDDLENNIVTNKPLLRTDKGIMVYMPTAIVSSLIQFTFDQAERCKCKELFLKSVLHVQLNLVKKAMERMGWHLTTIELPDDPLKLSNIEFVCQFDNQKLAYVCFVNTAAPLSEDAKKVVNPKAVRNKQVVECLCHKYKAKDVLTLYIFPDTGNNIMWKWDKPIDNNYHLMFTVHELDVISQQDEVDARSLWKFAKAFFRASGKVKFFSSGTLDLYGFYNENEGSLLNANENKSGEYAEHIFIAQQIKQDHHAIRTEQGGKKGLIPIHRHREYAPIYKPDEPYKGFALIVKSYRTPIWILNNQTTKAGNSNWGHAVAEAVAFWLIRISAQLSESFNEVRHIQFQVEIKIDTQLLEGGDFEVPSKLPDWIDLNVDVTPDLITIHVPFALGLLAWRPDNLADQVLIKVAIQGIVKCSAMRNAVINLTEEQMNKIITETLQPSNAKMLLFNNSHSEPRLDNRNLSRFYPIHDSDSAQVLDDLISYLPEDYVFPDVLETEEQKLVLVDDIIESLLSELMRRLAEFDGKALIQCLIHLNESCTQKKEFLEILRPPRIACFSSFQEEVKKILDEGQALIASGHALRTLVEFAGTNLPTGVKKPSFDSVGELMAFADTLMELGFLHEVLENRLDNPAMGKLPSGRFGFNKDFFKLTLEPLHEARAQGKVLSELEKFDTKYSQAHENASSAGVNYDALNIAFNAEFGCPFDDLNKVYFVLTEEGFEKGEPVVKRSEAELIAKLVSMITDMNEKKAKTILDYLTLSARAQVLFTKNEKGEYEKQFVPWRFNRTFSYLIKPLVKGKDKQGNDCYYYGYRHLQVAREHLFYLIFNGKLPWRTSKEMDSFIGSIAKDIGLPFEKEVREWLKNNTDLDVQAEEIYPRKLSKRSADEKYGDIDVLAVDHNHKIIYSIECKNTRGAKNVIEMVGEMNDYLGRDGDVSKAKILKHFGRDRWLKENTAALNALVPNAHEYSIKSLVLTADELSVEYLGKGQLLLPILSFSKLKLQGKDTLTNLQ